ncbi:MAG: XTP/dITP diphosphatase [Thermosphaera sp.]
MYPSEVFFATGNKHKFDEVKPIASKYGFVLKQYPGVKFEVQSDDLRVIARTAAIQAYGEVGKPILVEDAGLFVEALNGFPGPYSSFVYKTIGVEGLLKLMKDIADRRACFKSVAVLIYEPYFVVKEGEVCGHIAHEARGDKGFGFDPVFIPDGSDKTFAEMSIEEKNLFSHRAKAVEGVFSFLREHGLRAE